MIATNYIDFISSTFISISSPRGKILNSNRNNRQNVSSSRLAMSAATDTRSEENLTQAVVYRLLFIISGCIRMKLEVGNQIF